MISSLLKSPFIVTQQKNCISKPSIPLEKKEINLVIGTDPQKLE